MSKTLAILSLFACLLNAGIYAETFPAGARLSVDRTWPFHVPVLILFLFALGFLFAGTWRLGQRMRRMSQEELHNFRDTLESTHRPRLLGSTPKWMVIVVAVLALVFIGQMIADAARGIVMPRDGQLWLHNVNEQPIRPLTPEERAVHQLNEVRIASSGCALFAFVAFGILIRRDSKSVLQKRSHLPSD